VDNDDDFATGQGPARFLGRVRIAALASPAAAAARRNFFSRQGVGQRQQLMPPMPLSEISTLAACQRLAARPIDRKQDEECCHAPVAEELPVGFVYNGFPHAVMMATPNDLEDFAAGFSVTEGVIENPHGMRALSIHPSGGGIELAIDLVPDALKTFLRRRRVRSLRGHTSCGICGVEDIAQLTEAPVPERTIHPPIASLDVTMLKHAVARLRDMQPLSRLTRCAHAAAWVDENGTFRLVREDVGRHNALDKLIGGCLRERIDTMRGFCLVTSRCSFEMVQKAIVARFPILVAISAPTALAIRTAQRVGLALVALDRHGEPCVYEPTDRDEAAMPTEPNAPVAIGPIALAQKAEA
jgi:FdhD protein